MPNPEPQVPPDDLESRHQPVRPAEDAERPDWLVGADEGLTQELDAAWTPPADRRPVLTRIDSPREAPAPAKPEPPRAWTAAAPSVPKLTVVPRRERPARDEDLPGDVGDHEPLRSGPEEDLESEAPREIAPLPIRPHDEPLWLVWGEFLATNRPLQIGLVAVVVAVLAYAYWPRQENMGVPLRDIRRHPERFEGRSVRVQGKVGEVFDIGSGYVFHLIQGRDTVVVFSPARRPQPHDKVRVAGSVSTGFLDGVARVAIFETPGDAPKP